jgi:hypothetical protein
MIMVSLRNGCADRAIPTEYARDKGCHVREDNGVVTLWLHCGYTVVTLLLHYSNTIVNLVFLKDGLELIARIVEHGRTDLHK